MTRVARNLYVSSTLGRANAEQTMKPDSEKSGSGFLVIDGGGEAPTRDALYGRRWKKASKAFLAEYPLCQCPQCDEGRKRVRAATIVDHKVAHRGDPALFWDMNNWQALAKECHDSYKQRLEKTGRMIGANEDGVPIDPAHHWNTTGGSKKSGG